MWSRAACPSIVSTRCPRTSAQSHGLSAEWIRTVARGSRVRFLTRCGCGSVFTRRYSPSESTHVSNACGRPSGIRVTPVARFGPWASRTTAGLKDIGVPLSQLRGADDEVERGSRPPDAQRQRLADAVGEHPLLEGA